MKVLKPEASHKEMDAMESVQSDLNNLALQDKKIEKVVKEQAEAARRAHERLLELVKEQSRYVQELKQSKQEINEIE